ncbi:MAG TPA: RES family NAD+ phosphorylase [Gemmatimonadales bacterium]|nr:RES family NAD+ phosphorylase [Gemmatimonadales bacterium]
MTGAWQEPEQVAGLRSVGSPVELYRVTDAVYGDQALADWAAYVRRTLAASMAAGGRFNPPCEFGAVYTATDERTAWAEVAARYAREGVRGLPAATSVLRIVVLAGSHVDLVDERTREAWGATRAMLVADDGIHVAACHALGRAVRAVADFFESPSARGAGANVPLFADRDDGELRMDLAGVDRRPVPEALRQRSRERW